MKLAVGWISVFFLTPAYAFSPVITDPISPAWEGRPILALLEEEMSLEPVKQVEIILSRSSMVCELLGQPAGRFRSVNGKDCKTTPFLHDGKVVVVDRGGRRGALRARLVRLDPERKAEIFRSTRCVGNR